MDISMDINIDTASMPDACQTHVGFEQNYTKLYFFTKPYKTL
jgi:hypothetical protein